VFPVVALVPRLMVAPATSLRARCRESCRSAPVTTEEVAEVLVVAGVFWASRLISLIPPGCTQRHVIPALKITPCRPFSPE